MEFLVASTSFIFKFLISIAFSYMTLNVLDTYKKINNFIIRIASISLIWGYVYSPTVGFWVLGLFLFICIVTPDKELDTDKWLLYTRTTLIAGFILCIAYIIFNFEVVKVIEFFSNGIFTIDTFAYYAINFIGLTFSIVTFIVVIYYYPKELIKDTRNAKERESKLNATRNKYKKNKNINY